MQSPVHMTSLHSSCMPLMFIFVLYVHILLWNWRTDSCTTDAHKYVDRVTKKFNYEFVCDLRFVIFGKPTQFQLDLSKQSVTHNFIELLLFKVCTYIVYWIVSASLDYIFYLHLDETLGGLFFLELYSLILNCINIWRLTTTTIT